MFNMREAFAHLDGKTFANYLELREELLNIRRAHRTELPPGCGPNRLYELAVQNNWVTSSGTTITISMTS